MTVALSLLAGLIAGLLAGAGVMRWLDSTVIAGLKLDVMRERGTAEHHVETIITMRQQGFTQQMPATVREGPDPESEGLARAEAQLIHRRDDAHFIQRAKTEIMKKNPRVSEREALAEAVRLRNEIKMEDPPT